MNIIMNSDSGLRDLGLRVMSLGVEIPEDLDEQRWARALGLLCRGENWTAWAVGDCAAFGARFDNGRIHFGALKEFAEVHKQDYQTLANKKYVSQAVAISRRREKVPWSLHAELASRPVAEQVRWLERVEREALKRSELRRLLRLALGEMDGTAKDGPKIVEGTDLLEAFLGWLREEQAARPVDGWSPERKAKWLELLGPVVAFIEMLKAEG